MYVRSYYWFIIYILAWPWHKNPNILVFLTLQTFHHKLATCYPTADAGFPLI